MIDEMRTWGIVAPPILGDAAYGDVTGLRTGLEERGLEYVLHVRGATSAVSTDSVAVTAEHCGRGRYGGLASSANVQSGERATTTRAGSPRRRRR